MADKVVLAFDLYGTLLSTASISKELAKYLESEDVANQVATTWRTQQLEYTWRLNSMGKYEDFHRVTSRSLIHALRLHGCDTNHAEEVMASYDEALSTFPDVDGALSALHKHTDQDKYTCVVFSNGLPAMLQRSLHRTGEASLHPHADLFEDIISVHDVQRFKPHPVVYRYLTEKTEMQDSPEKVWLVSGNPFDVVGAQAAGIRAVWVDREGKGWMDELVSQDEGKPTLIVKSLDEVATKVEAWLKEHSKA